MQQGGTSFRVTCCRVLLRNSWLSAWLCPLPSAFTSSFVFWKHFRSQRVVGGLCASPPSQSTLILPLIPFHAWDSTSPGPSAPTFFRGIRGWGPKRKCGDVLGRDCLQKMVLESFLYVGGIWLFSPSSFHGGTQGGCTVIRWCSIWWGSDSLGSLSLLGRGDDVADRLHWHLQAPRLMDVR